jgi:hypothetical protein
VQQQVYAEGTGGRTPQLLNASTNLFRLEVRCTENTKPAGVRNGRCQFRTSNRGHAGLENRVLYAEEIAHACMQAPPRATCVCRGLCHAASAHSGRGRGSARLEEVPPLQRRRIAHGYPLVKVIVGRHGREPGRLHAAFCVLDARPTATDVHDTVFRVDLVANASPLAIRFAPHSDVPGRRFPVHVGLHDGP